MSFYLSEETPFHIDTEAWARPAPHGGAFWQVLPHARPARLGLVILAGSRVAFAHVIAETGAVGLLVIGAALPEISPDGLEVVVRVDGVEVHRGTVARFDAESPWVEVAFEPGRGGGVSVECLAGPEGNPCGDWLAVYELVVARPEEMGLWRARAFRAWREKNEKEHFSATAATHPLAPEEKKGWFSRLRTPRSLSLSPPGAQRYAGDLLQKRLNRPIPDFTRRLQDRLDRAGKGARPRVLSLCSGMADKEAKLLGSVRGSDKVVLTLMELNGDLVQRAARQLAPVCDLRATAMDANALDLGGERYDVILCAAGLHHLIELEHVVEEISRGLAAEGEFWSIGEYIGRSGARLWPDAYGMANPFFRRLPERYRVNRSLPDGRADTDLPNFDCSIGTFEGIRSEEIDGILNRVLLPHSVTKQACFLWRFFDGAYLANWDVQRKEDLNLIRRAVSLDAEHQRLGGRPTNLNGVYRKRM